MDKILSYLGDKVKQNDATLFDDFRTIVLMNDKELVIKIWDTFPNYVWTYLNSHLFEELHQKGQKDMLELFIKNNKLCGGSYLLLENEGLNI